MKAIILTLLALPLFAQVNHPVTPSSATLAPGQSQEFRFEEGHGVWTCVPSPNVGTVQAANTNNPIGFTATYTAPASVTSATTVSLRCTNNPASNPEHIGFATVTLTPGGDTGSVTTADSIIVRAKGEAAASVFPQVRLEVGGVTIGELPPLGATEKPYTIKPAGAFPSGNLDIVFVNDVFSGNGNDRNVFIKNVTVDGKVFPATDTGITFIGNGPCPGPYPTGFEPNTDGGLWIDCNGKARFPIQIKGTGVIIQPPYGPGQPAGCAAISSVRPIKLEPGSDPTAFLDPATCVLTIGIPKGEKGDSAVGGGSTSMFCGPNAVQTKVGNDIICSFDPIAVAASDSQVSRDPLAAGAIQKSATKRHGKR